MRARSSKIPLLDNGPLPLPAVRISAELALFSLAQSLDKGGIRLDPMTLVPLLAAATKKVGIVATASTTFYPPTSRRA